ncbi:MAG: FAD-dependent oxidoreductase [Chloroflexi bacterium]|nr:FAD-dependent oxidoreductase [Chloroflexota bacterium]
MTTQRVDTLIIGGGVIGVCAAYFLAETGRSVTLVEKNDIASGASYGNAGLIAVDHAIPLPAPGALTQGLRWLLDSASPFYIKPRLDPDLIRWLWLFRGACKREKMLRAIPILLALGRASIALYDEMHARHPLEDAYQRRGRLFLYRTQSALDHAKRELELLQQFGVRGDVLDAVAVHERFPPASSAVIGGVFYEDYAHFSPHHFVKNLARVAQSLGADIRQRTEVLSFETSGKRIAKVRTTRGDFQAEAVVLAAGAWSAPLGRALGLRLPIQPAKGYSITARRPADYPELPVQLSDDMVAVTPMGDALRFSSTLEMAGFDMRINQRRIDASRRAMRDYVRAGGELEEIELWRGFRPMSPDDLPLIGRSAALGNLIVATGHSMLGMTQGAITGKLVSQLIAGEPPDLELTPFSPDRF